MRRVVYGVCSGCNPTQLNSTQVTQLIVLNHNTPYSAVRMYRVSVPCLYTLLGERQPGISLADHGIMLVYHLLFNHARPEPIPGQIVGNTYSAEKFMTLSSF